MRANKKNGGFQGFFSKVFSIIVWTMTKYTPERTPLKSDTHQKWTSHFRALRKATVQTHGKLVEISALPRETSYHRETGLIFR